MFIDNDAASSQCRAKACGWNLKDAIGELDGVVSGHDAFMLNGENPIQVQMRDRHKRRAGLGCRDNEFAIELRDIVASQKMVRFINGPDLSDAKLLRASALLGSKVPFAAPARLRRIGRNGFDTDVFQSTTDFGQLTGIDPLAGLRCPEEVTGTVTIERGEPTLGMDHVSDRRHYGSRRFLLDQLRVINLTGGVVQNSRRRRQGVAQTPPRMSVGLYPPIDESIHSMYLSNASSIVTLTISGSE